MGFLNFFFGGKSKDKARNQKAVTKNINVDKMSEYGTNTANQNSDIADGLMFSATCQVRTPLHVLLKHGEIYRNNGTPPTYGNGSQDGMWRINVCSEYQYDDNHYVASDAGSVPAEDYIKFAIGLRTIFESELPIIEKMEKIIDYGENLDNEIKYIAKSVIRNRGGSRGNKKDNLADVMATHLSETDLKIWYFDQPNHLTIVNGINKKVAEALESHDLTTMQEIADLCIAELIKFDGIGKVSAQKIVDDCSNIKKLRTN